MAEPFYRYERKLLVEEIDAHQVRAMVRAHPCCFREPYPPRYVNNVYLDTVDLDNYFDNINGALERRKVRVRWYGEFLGPIAQPVLEFKIKQGMVGTKEQYPLAPFVLDETFSTRTMQELFKRSELPPLVRSFLGDLQAVIFNRYYRYYFATTDGRYRATIDCEMSFANVRRPRAATCRHEDRCRVIVELKYQPVDEQYADRIAGYFPFPVARNSKYVQGVEAVYL